MNLKLIQVWTAGQVAGRQYDGAVGSTVTLQLPGWSLAPAPFSAEFACSPHVGVGSLRVLLLPIIHVRLIGVLNCECVDSVMINWLIARTPPWPSVSWDRLQRPRPGTKQQMKDGSMLARHDQQMLLMTIPVATVNWSVSVLSCWDISLTFLLPPP